MSLGERFLDLMEHLPGAAERRRAWSQLASRRGGQYYPPQGGFLSRTPAMADVPVNDVVVNVTTRTEGSGDASETFTVFRSSWLLGSGPEFRVTRAGMFSRVGRALGLQDVALGDAVFDAQHVVKTNAPVATRAVFGRAARDAYSFLAKGRVVATQTQVEYAWSGTMKNPQRLALGVDLVGGLASHGSAWVAALRQLPGSFNPPDGAWNLRRPPFATLEFGVSQIKVMAVAHDWGFEIVASTELRRDVSPFRLQMRDDGTPHEDPPDGLLDAESFRGLQRLGGVTVSNLLGGVQLHFAGSPDTERIVSGAKWLASFAEGGRSRGAFR